MPPKIPFYLVSRLTAESASLITGPTSSSVTLTHTHTHTHTQGNRAQVEKYRNPPLSPPESFLLSSPSRCFLSLPDCGVDGLGGVLAFSPCDRAVIHIVCKPFERCLNTPQPPFHPTHTREPNNTSKLPPVAPPAPLHLPLIQRARGETTAGIC